jgi:hypothetical protein
MWANSEISFSFISLRRFSIFDEIFFLFEEDSKSLFFCKTHLAAPYKVRIKLPDINPLQ